MSEPHSAQHEAAGYLRGLFGLEGQVALVTGASRGLGAAIALGLARAGARVALVGRQGNLGESLTAIAAAGGEASAVVGDLSSREGVDRLVLRCEEQVGPVTILVNNAGTFDRKPALNWTDESWEQVMKLSTQSVFWLCQRVGRGMLERKSGKIINIASVLSFQGGWMVPAYAASRHALVGLTRSLGNEWAASGVNVNAIAPGYFDTDLLSDLKNDPERAASLLARVPAGRWGRPEEIVGAALFLASSASQFVHGSTVVVDGGWLSR
jgi:2-dehydro-3-deoxy-D-gluconate 5-dehydrogenase